MCERVGQSIDQPRCDAERDERRDRSEQLRSARGRRHGGGRARARARPASRRSTRRSPRSRRRAACRSAGSGASVRSRSRRRWPRRSWHPPRARGPIRPRPRPAPPAPSRSSRSVPGESGRERRNSGSSSTGATAVRTSSSRIDPTATITHHQRGSTWASQTTIAIAGAPSTSAISQPFARSSNQPPVPCREIPHVAREVVAGEAERQEHELEDTAHHDREDDRIDERAVRARRAHRRSAGPRTPPARAARA